MTEPNANDMHFLETRKALREEAGDLKQCKTVRFLEDAQLQGEAILCTVTYICSFSLGNCEHVIRNV